jgi:hypothetical protein
MTFWGISQAAAEARDAAEANEELSTSSRGNKADTAAAGEMEVAECAASDAAHVKSTVVSSTSSSAHTSPDGVSGFFGRLLFGARTVSQGTGACCIRVGEKAFYVYVRICVQYRNCLAPDYVPRYWCTSHRCWTYGVGDRRLFMCKNEQLNVIRAYVAENNAASAQPVVKVLAVSDVDVQDDDDCHDSSGGRESKSSHKKKGKKKS